MIKFNPLVSQFTKKDIQNFIDIKKEGFLTGIRVPLLLSKDIYDRCEIFPEREKDFTEKIIDEIRRAFIYGEALLDSFEIDIMIGKYSNTTKDITIIVNNCSLNELYEDNRRAVFISLKEDS